jgi:hypothetical protein
MDTKIQNYIRLVYSDKSDLNDITNLEDRKKQACERAKLPYDDEKTQEIVHMKNKDVNTAIFNFCAEQCPYEFNLLISKEHLFLEQMQMLMEPLKKTTDDGKTIEDVDEERMMKRINLKNTISEKSETLLISINELRTKIWKGTVEQKVAEAKIKSQRMEDRLNGLKRKA